MKRELKISSQPLITVIVVANKEEKEKEPWQSTSVRAIPTNYMTVNISLS